MICGTVNAQLVTNIALQLIRGNRQAFEGLCKHLGAAVATMEGFGEMLDVLGTPINADLKAEIRDRVDRFVTLTQGRNDHELTSELRALNDFHAFVVNKLRLRISDRLAKTQKYGTDIEQIRNTKERFFETMRLFSVSLNLGVCSHNLTCRYR